MDKTKLIEVVEDEKPMSDALREILEKEGFGVIVASDGITGYDVAVDKKPDLILLDIVLPKVNGLAMLEKLRKNDWGKTVPVIALTNYSEKEMIAEAMRLGISEYFVKIDWNLEDVVKQIKRRLEIK